MIDMNDIYNNRSTSREEINFIAVNVNWVLIVLLFLPTAPEIFGQTTSSVCSWELGPHQDIIAILGTASWTEGQCQYKDRRHVVKLDTTDEESRKPQKQNEAYKGEARVECKPVQPRRGFVSFQRR